MAIVDKTRVEELVAQAGRPHRLRGAATFADDIGAFGEWVGPRTGPDKRNQNDKNDYVLRRLLTAWKYANRLDYPLEFRRGDPRRNEPDFVLTWADRSLGVEITEAGEEVYQAWLTRREKEAVGAVPEPLPISTDRTAREVLRALKTKVEGFDGGKYRGAPPCDLAIYDNTASGGYLDKRDVLRMLGRPNDLLGRFRQIHLVFEGLVLVDLFGNEPSVIDVRNAYEIDFAAWAFDQAAKLKAGQTTDLDTANLAEELDHLGKSERRALGSHLRNLMTHLLKWQFQPRRRSGSWQNSIQLARSEIHQKLTEEPSLRGALIDLVATEYPRARRQASTETKLSVERFPEPCPYEPRQLIDPEFYPEG